MIINKTLSVAALSFFALSTTALAQPTSGASYGSPWSSNFLSGPSLTPEISRWEIRRYLGLPPEDAYDDIDDEIEDHLDDGMSAKDPHIVELEHMLDKLDNELAHRVWTGKAPCGSYLFVQLGGDFGINNHISSLDILGADGSHSSLGNGYMGGFGFRARLAHGVDGELSVGYHGGLGYGFSPDSTLHIKNDASAVSTLFNVKFYPGEVIAPMRPYTYYPGSSVPRRTLFYVEAGGGFSVNTLDRTKLNNGVSTINGDTRVSPAYDAGAGSKFDLTPMHYPRVFIDLGYRYTNLGQFHSGLHPDNRGPS